MTAGNCKKPQPLRTPKQFPSFPKITTTCTEKGQTAPNQLLAHKKRKQLILTQSERGFVLFCRMFSQRYWSLADPVGAWGPPPCSHVFFLKLCSFQAIMSKFWAQPPSGVKTLLSPPDQIPGSAPVMVHQSFFSG